METQFLNEHLAIGNTGIFLIVLSFTASLLSMVSFFLGALRSSNTWVKTGRWAFGIHSAAVLGIFTCLYIIIRNHYFEYHYAWQHSSRDLPMQYLVSCFWEGQEGSFLLWTFWNAVLGLFLIWRKDQWEPQVLAVIALCQVALSSMVLGIDMGFYVQGSNPFELLRVKMAEAPIFQTPDYLSKIADGNGLNPLLQNYWMVIHPPTLFLGFATTIIPFAYAIAGLWKRDFSGWIKASLPWALFSALVLGTGIMMGGIWAYESLSFGGYWAWDPVENASLVPWLTLIAGLHMALVYKSTGRGLKGTVIFYFLTFGFILYSTFLTRSGILGNTSVHAFTDLGMSGQLLIFMFIFVIIAAGLLLRTWKSFPKAEGQEHISSREFWMIIGSLVLCLSAIQIISTTSIPVYNKLLHLFLPDVSWLKDVGFYQKMLEANIAPPTDPIRHYNSWQLFLAVLIALISGASQFLKFKKTGSGFGRHAGISAAVALGFTVAMCWYFGLWEFSYILFLFASWFTLVSNGKVLWDAIRGKPKLAGSALSHIGFGLMLVGILLSSAKKETISINKSGFSYGKEFDESQNRENVLLWKGQPLLMGEYRITYTGDSIQGINHYYNVRYQKLDKDSNVVSEFTLSPNAQLNPKMGLLANPDSKHYLHHDVFTFVTSVPDKEADKKDDNFIRNSMFQLGIGDTVHYATGIIKYLGIEKLIADTPQNLKGAELLAGAKLEVMTNDTVYNMLPIIGIVNHGGETHLENEAAYIQEIGLKVKFTSLNPGLEKVQLEVLEKAPLRDYIIMKAIRFPWINLLWAGTVVMMIGFAVSMRRRIKENKAKHHVA